MNNIIKPLRKELDELKSEITKLETLKAQDNLSYEMEMTLSCDRVILERFENVYRTCLAEYEKIKKVDI